MALPSSTTIQNLTRCKTLPGFFPGGFREELLRRIDFEDVTGYGQAVQVSRATLGAAVNYAAGGTMPLNASSAALAAFDFKRIGDTVEVDSADITSSEEAQQQLDMQVAMKRVALLRRLAQQVVQGTGTGDEVEGLASGVDAAQTIDPETGAGMVPVLDDFHRMLAMVSASDDGLGNGPDALVMHPRTRRLLAFLLETTGGGAEYAMDDAIGNRVLLFEGLPVYASESISTTEDTAGAPTGGVLSSVYGLKLDGPTGVRVLHQGGDTNDFGIAVEELTPQLNIAKRATTVRGCYALLIPEVASAARLKAVAIAGFPA
jgi:hypothetical protein